jgi:thioesterase domain-containing protein
MLDDIPLARHIGVQVLAWDGHSLVLGAPLDANSNHKGTAFGGSLYSLAVLAGWGVLLLELEARGIDAEIVIQACAVDYRMPVTGDFTARAVAPDRAQIERCVRMFNRYGKARIEIATVIERQGLEAVRMRGTYVIGLTEPPSLEQ